MGHAADILGVRQAFLRGLDAAKLLTPQRSSGGHRRYSRYQLRIAARAHELVAAGTPLEAACRTICQRRTGYLHRELASRTIASFDLVSEVGIDRINTEVPTLSDLNF
ncbi:hypothetical protein CVN56_26390 [Rhodococcus sp. AQ5-07]|uniref:MerR family transcriptional regulator n=1 Tax=Rhodococcus sp. AQ5-07 TaxID=2054902 RepID=UPI000DBF8CA0|nr:MerR family transcriptional regulator [Rhodococcus sp. AQ5-07]RAL31695.1 hypothetical protein CVN56_26390 [Rhodococcus sp. AQ5-07]